MFSTFHYSKIMEGKFPKIILQRILMGFLKPSNSYSSKNRINFLMALSWHKLSEPSKFIDKLFLKIYFYGHISNTDLKAFQNFLRYCSCLPLVKIVFIHLIPILWAIRFVYSICYFILWIPTWPTFTGFLQWVEFISIRKFQKFISVEFYLQTSLHDHLHLTQLNS